jgi:cation transport ATPase
MTAATATGPRHLAAAPDSREVTLAIEGMTCAACAARVEKKLNQLGGVSATVNYATGTARVTAPASLPGQELTAAVSQAGYPATECPARHAGDAVAADGRTEDPAGPDAARHFAALRRRLIVALVLFIPLTDLSLALSLLPSVRFPGWQWVLAGCAAPVALWCAWPFHRAALSRARHGGA